ncbi:MAG: hypothetical protein K1X72_10375 [Pyrinomonadaceae bacterium]|nr:hypothetical protein [Pyrinomonadaceae bacterium]
MKLLIMVLLLLITPVIVFGQTKKTTSSKPTSKTPVTEIEGITKDGKKVILRSDKTWYYAPESNNSNTKQLGRIEIEAGLVFKNGDIKPVSRLNLLLLKQNPRTFILTEENFNLYYQDKIDTAPSPGFRELYKKETKFNSWTLFEAVTFADGSIQTKPYATAVKAAFAVNTVATITTGFDGKGIFEGIPIGNYFIFAYYQVGNESVIWSIPININSGTNKLILDNNNISPPYF